MQLKKLKRKTQEVFNIAEWHLEFSRVSKWEFHMIFLKLWAFVFYCQKPEQDLQWKDLNILKWRYIWVGFFIHKT